MTIKASDLFVKCLEEEGVTHIFGVPGEENLDVLDSIRKSKIEMVLTRNEQTAVFMAATYGRFVGKPGVAIATLGPGATNMVTGVGYAQLNGYPTIVITGQKPIRKSKQGDFQVLNIVEMMNPITKLATQLQSGARINTTIRNAFKTAMSERPGCVHIELPEDIARVEVIEHKPITPEYSRRPLVEEKAVKTLVEQLEKAKSPTILIGAGANRKRVTNYLTKFIKKYNIPFFESQMGKGVVSEDLPQYVGTAALSANDSVHKVVERSDLILSVGHDTIEKPTNFIEEGKTKTIHINFYEAKIDDVYTPSLEIIGDIGNLFYRLCEEQEIDNSGWHFDAMYEIAQEEFEKMNASKDLNEDKVMGPRRLVRDLREFMPRDGIVALDNGWYKIFMARNYKTYYPNTLMLDNTFATMGAGMPTGLMAKMLNQDKEVVVVTGDGGLVMNLGDLETCVTQKVDITIVVLNNNQYGMIRVKQKQAGLEEYSLGLPNPDFVKLADSFGAKGYKVEDPNDFLKTLKLASSEKGLKIIELMFDYGDEEVK